MVPFCLGDRTQKFVRPSGDFYTQSTDWCENSALGAADSREAQSKMGRVACEQGGTQAGWHMLLSQHLGTEAGFCKSEESAVSAEPAWSRERDPT